eukprot:3201812-Heterocapsa_arctica.AAC.1
MKPSPLRYQVKIKQYRCGAVLPDPERAAASSFAAQASPRGAARSHARRRGLARAQRAPGRPRAA